MPMRRVSLLVEKVKAGGRSLRRSRTDSLQQLSLLVNYTDKSCPCPPPEGGAKYSLFSSEQVRRARPSSPERPFAFAPRTSAVPTSRLLLHLSSSGPLYNELCVALVASEREPDSAVCSPRSSMFVDAPTASLAAPALRPLQLARSPSPFALAEVSPPTFTSDAGMKRQRSPQGGVADPDLARSARIDGSQLVLGQTEAQEVPFVLSDASDGTASQPPAQVNASEGSKFGSPNCSTANEFLPDLPEARLDPAYDLAFGLPEWEIDTEAAVSSSSIVGAHLVGFDDSLFSSVRPRVRTRPDEISTQGRQHSAEHMPRSAQASSSSRSSAPARRLASTSPVGSVQRATGKSSPS